MKKVRSNDSSIKTLMNHINCEMYTRQTLVSLFRCLVETIIESGENSVILIKLKDTNHFQGLLNRLKYSESKVYSYSEITEADKFSSIKLDNADINKDEFLVIIADRFSACLAWEETKSDILDLYQGFCSLNPEDSKKITDHLQQIAFDKKLENDLNEIKQDRRSNVKFTTILRKFTESFESHQRDLICANTELEDLQKKANQTDELANIGQNCSIIAHEIRNPLGMISLYAKIIEKNAQKINDIELNNSLKGAAGTIISATENLEDLLTQILDLSKNLKLSIQENDLNLTVNEVINLAKPAFDNKKVKLCLNEELNKEIEIKFDKAKISQVLLNLIKNALEVSKEDDLIEINLTLKNEKAASITVKDQGPGILPENKVKLFMPFFTTKKEGTGLGLAQSKKIIEAHNGTLNVISTDSNGTTFELTIPIESNL